MSEPPDDKAVAESGSDTVMIVEPDVVARMVLADYLRNCGYKVIEGSKGEDVLAVIEAGGVLNLVLTEVKLPGELDGFGLATKIRSEQPDIDVILTNSVANAADKAGSLCDDGPLEKPYHPQEVVRRIKLLRERRRTSRQS